MLFGIILIVSQTILAQTDPTQESMSLFEKAARLCAPYDQISCIVERLYKNESLLYGCPISYADKVNTIDCVEQELYGSVEMQKLRYADATCCNVFSDNFNDDECEPLCEDTLSTPSIQTDAKHEKMSSCNRQFPAIFECFEQCVAARKTTRLSEAVAFKKQKCSWESLYERLSPNEIRVLPRKVRRALSRIHRSYLL